jgi:hypothetical protein
MNIYIDGKIDLIEKIKKLENDIQSLQEYLSKTSNKDATLEIKNKLKKHYL